MCVGCSPTARKSMRPTAERLGVDHQQLQQFVTSSTWDYTTVRMNVARWAVEAIDPAAYVDARTSLKALVRLAKLRWRVEHDYREFTTGLGIDHFEGRSFVGWHRHVTLTVLAQAFCTLLRLDPKAMRRPDPLCRAA